MALDFSKYLPTATAEKPKEAPAKKSGALDFNKYLDQPADGTSTRLDFSKYLTAPAAQPTAPTLGQEQPMSFDESKSLLSWTAPPPPPVQGPMPATDIERRSEAGLHMPAEVGALLMGADPITSAALRLAGAGASALGGKLAETAGKMLTPEAEMMLAKGQPLIEKMAANQAPEALLTEQISPTASLSRAPGIKEVGPSGISKLTETVAGPAKAAAASAFPDEPAKFKVLDQPPITQPTETLPDATVQAVVNKAVAEPLPTSGVTTPNLTVQSAKDVVDAARALQQRNPDFVVEGDTVNRLFKRIGTAVRTGVISIDDLSPKFREAGYTPTLVADLYETSVSQGAQTMNQLSQFARELNNTVKNRIAGMPDLPPSPFDKLYATGKTVTNLWRTALTSTLATASRNFITGMKLVGAETLNEAAVVAEKSLFLRQPLKQAMDPLIEHIYAIGRRLTPEGRTQLAAVLDKEPILKMKLYGTPVNDALMTDKVSSMLSVFNRTQEYFVREIATSMGVARRMTEAGLNPKTSPVPFKILDAAIQDALEITMAATPQNKLARGMIKAFNEFYPLQLAYPFPRYLANSVGTLYKWSVAKPAWMAASGSLYKLPVEEQLRTINRAVIGSSMMAAAAYLRHTKYAGENWYEVKTDPDVNPGKVVDLRPYGPMLPGHLFVTELYNRLQRKAETGQPIGFSAKDYMEGTLGINRMAGTTLFSISQLSGKNIENVNEFAARYAGEFLGGFTTPFRTFRDLISTFAPDEATFRDVRQAPLTGPALANIPFAQKLVPEKNFATSTENQREEMGTRQLFGWSAQTKDPLRVELDRLQIPSMKVEPRTGIPEMDNLVRGEMAKILERQGPKLISGKYYQDRHTSDKDRMDALSALISSVKDNAIGRIMMLRPDLRKQLEEKDADKRLMERTVGTGGIE